MTPAVPPVTFAKSAVTPLGSPKLSVPQVQVKAQAYVAVPIFYQASLDTFLKSQAYLLDQGDCAIFFSILEFLHLCL